MTTAQYYVSAVLVAIVAVGALWGWIAMVVLGVFGVSVGYWTAAVAATALVFALNTVKGIFTTD